MQAVTVEALHQRRILQVAETGRGRRLHRQLSADTQPALVRRVHQGLVAFEDVTVALRRRRRPPPQGGVRVRQRRDEVVQDTGRQEL